MECNGKKFILPLFVVDGAGWQELVSVFNTGVKGVYNMVDAGEDKVKQIVSEYEQVFNKELGTIKGVKAKIHVDPDAKPNFIKDRPVPFAMKGMVEKELDRLVSENVISPVQFSQWAAPIVPAIKHNGSIRICEDFKVIINQVSQVDSYLLPRVDKLFAAMSGGKRFTMLDLAQAYLQVIRRRVKEICNYKHSSRVISIYCLPFGVSSAPAIFQRCMEIVLHGCKNIDVYYMTVCHNSI